MLPLFRQTCSDSHRDPIKTVFYWMKINMAQVPVAILPNQRFHNPAHLNKSDNACLIAHLTKQS